MMNLIKKVLFFLLLNLFSGCGDEKNNFGNVSIEDSENTFVLGDGDDIALLEFEPEKKRIEVKFQQRRSGSLLSRYHAQHNKIVYINSYRGWGEGIGIFDLKNGTEQRIEIGEGGGDVFLVPYDDGYLFASKRLNQSPIDTSLGYFSPYEIGGVEFLHYDFIKNPAHVLSNEKSKHRYKKVHYLSLENNVIEAKYSMSILDHNASIEGDWMYGLLHNTYVKVNLNSKRRVKIFDSDLYPEIEKPGNHEVLYEMRRRMPNKSIVRKVGKHYVFVTTIGSKNTFDEVSRESYLSGGYESKTIYRYHASTDSFIKVNKLEDNQVYLLPNHENESLIAFSNSGHINEIDIETGNSVSKFQFSIDQQHIMLAGQTKNYYLVFSGSSRENKVERVSIIDKEFKNTAQVFLFSTLGISMSSSLHFSSNASIEMYVNHLGSN